tara:strand:+ start:299 stop:607 length:309 start_codon:yes stop_codon:yes gene_type:complete
MSNDNVIYADFTKKDEFETLEECINRWDDEDANIVEDKYFAVHGDDGVMHYLGDFKGGEEGFIAANKAAAEIGIDPIVIINGGIANQWERCIIESLLLGFAG